MPITLHLSGDGRVTATYPDGTSRTFAAMCELMAAHGVETARVELEEP